MIRKSAFLLFLCLFLLGFFLRPAACMEAFLTGVSLWATTVLPAVFPFLVCITLLSGSGVLPRFCRLLSPATGLLFGCSGMGGFCILTSLISGYPVGSKLLSSCVEEGSISREEGKKLSPVCSTSGPLFLVGSVGTGMLASPKLGAILLASHIGATLLTGLAFRALPAGRTPPSPIRSGNNTLYDDILNSVLTVLCVGAFIALFAVICELLSPLFALLPPPWSGFLQGLIEMTRGCKLLSASPSRLNLALTAFLTTFGGVCALSQQIAFLKKAGLPVPFYLAGKLLQGTFAFLLCYLISAQQF